MALTRFQKYATIAGSIVAIGSAMPYIVTVAKETYKVINAANHIEEVKQDFKKKDKHVREEIINQASDILLLKNQIKSLNKRVKADSILLWSEQGYVIENEKSIKKLKLYHEN